MCTRSGGKEKIVNQINTGVRWQPDDTARNYRSRANIDKSQKTCTLQANWKREHVGNLCDCSLGPSWALLLWDQPDCPWKSAGTRCLSRLRVFVEHLRSQLAPGLCFAESNELTGAQSAESSENNWGASNGRTDVAAFWGCGEHCVAMAAIAADCGASEKRWIRGMNFSFSAGSGYVEKVCKAATTTVHFGQKVLWSTSHAAKMAGSSILVYVAPKYFQASEVYSDLEGGPPSTPRSSSVKWRGFAEYSLDLFCSFFSIH